MSVLIELRSFWSGMVEHLWLATFVILALVLVERTLLRRAPLRLAAVPWGAALLVLCVPASRVTSLAERVWGGWFESGPEIVAPAAPLRAVLMPALLPPAPAVPRIWPWLVMTLIWLAGAALLATWIARRTRAATVTVDTIEGAIERRLAAAARRAGVPLARIHVTRSECLPHARGVLRPRVVVSAVVVEALPAEELAAVLLHESAHLRRRDPLRRTLYRAVLLFFWFFPLAWLVLRRLERAAEMACDQVVLRAGFARSVYARAIARTIRVGVGWQPAAAVGLAGPGGSDLRERLAAIERRPEETNMKRNVLGMALIMAIVCAALLAAAPSTAGGVLGGQVDEAVRVTAGIGNQFEALLGLQGVGRTVDVDVEDTLQNILLQLARTGGFRIRFEDFEAATISKEVIRLQLSNTTVGEAMVYLGRTYGVRYEVVSRDEVTVRRPLRGGTIKRRPTETRESPLPIGGEIQAPERVHYEPPRYPQPARDQGLEGVVILEAVIDTEGNVREATVLRGIANVLDEAALESVRQWKYTPTLYEGRPVDVLLTVTVQFQLQ